MIGGLSKSISRLALVAAAGVIVGGVAMPSAKAADLGGDCCADLEERVAELEATTARKGNRKVSLTVSGQVNQAIIFWDDGGKSGTYYGLNNNNSTSRFQFAGDGRVTSKVKVGFLFAFEWGSNTSSGVSQLDEDGKNLYFGGGANVLAVGQAAALAASANGNNQDGVLEVIQANWWIEDSSLGRITVGRQQTAGSVTTVDLAGISAVASGSFALLNGSFYLRNTAGALTALQWSKMTDPAANQGRQEALRYDTPAIAGFIGTASIGEAGDTWGVMLRYAGEFSGFRIAGGIGYEKITDKQTGLGVDGLYVTAGEPEVKAWGGSLALLHVPSGLFVQGHYQTVEFANGTNTDANAAAAILTAGSSYWNHEVADKAKANHWLVQAGITKNWFGLGNTALYGEYGKANDFGTRTIAAGRTFACLPFGCANLTPVAGVTGTELTVWGLGIVQNLDGAATELYLGYRNFSADLTYTAAGSQFKFQDIDVVAAGARIKF